MWRLLRQGFHQHRFRKQAPLRHFIVDFACHRPKLVIEVDGGQHGGPADDARTAVIEGEGYRVLRFWNDDLLGNPDGVWTAIDGALREQSSKALPLDGGGLGGGDASTGTASLGIHPTPAPPHQGEGK